MNKKTFFALMLSMVWVISPRAQSPEAPSGWERSTESNETVYRPSQYGKTVEFRLHAAEAGVTEVGAWFASQIKTPPQGISITRLGQPTQTKEGVYSVVSFGARGGAQLFVIGMGCRSQSGNGHYGELITPADQTIVQNVVVGAALVIAQSCLQPGLAGKPADKPAPAPAAQPKPTPPATENKPLPASSSLPPEKQLKTDKIEAILYSWRQYYQYTGLTFEETTYLLLKDGTWTYAPREALDEFDIEASRANKKHTWGRWRKNGTSYQLGYDKPDSFSSPPGQIIYQPAKPDERLSGRFETASSGSIGTTAYWSSSSITFNSDGRFSLYSSGGAGGSTAPGTEQNVTAVSVYDDNGSASSISSSTYAGGGSSKSGKPRSDRAGTYRLNGYTLELHYDNGKVERRLFFTDSQRHNVWFGGSMMMKPKSQR